MLLNTVWNVNLLVCVSCSSGNALHGKDYKIAPSCDLFIRYNTRRLELTCAQLYSSVAKVSQSRDHGLE